MHVELLGCRPAGSVVAVMRIGENLRQLVSIGAPATLESERVQVKDHYTPAEIAVGAIEADGGPGSDQKGFSIFKIGDHFVVSEANFWFERSTLARSQMTRIPFSGLG